MLIKSCNRTYIPAQRNEAMVHEAAIREEVHASEERRQTAVVWELIEDHRGISQN